MLKLTQTAIGITATALTPFYYHGLYTRDGSVTHPQVITDTTLIFALRAALLPTPLELQGFADWQTKQQENFLMGSPPVMRATSQYYKDDLNSIPWRASLLMGIHNPLLAPIRHSIEVEREGGYQDHLQKSMRSGNYKKNFHVAEVDAGASYQGILFGLDPFEETDNIIVRVGVSRLGMLQLRRVPEIKEVRLNVATAKLFARDLPEEYRILDTIRVSQKRFSVAEATTELQHWY